MLQEIIQILQTPANEVSEIPQARVRAWMNANDADTLGATQAFLMKANYTERVIPPLEFDLVFDFMLKYYEFCLVTNPESKWANSAYSAGCEMVGWFRSMWDEKREKKYFETMKSLLARLYCSGSPELKKCIEHAIIEHLFERRPIRKFFKDWLANPQLRPAYDEGILWIAGGRPKIPNQTE